MVGFFNGMENNTGNYKDYIFTHLLPYVNKPGRYIGNEVNIVRKNPDDVDIRIALVFPDVYEVGMSYQGYAILYHILNRLKGVYAERAFAPWPDMEAAMREKDVPLYTLETFTPVDRFDVVGFTFQYEMHFTTILNLLDLSGVPLESRQRTRLPLVLGGGPSGYNPEPLADYFDAMVIGDAEQVVVKIVQHLGELKQLSQPRDQMLRTLARIDGIYVPGFYQPVYDSSGVFSGLQVVQSDAPVKIRAATLDSLAPENYPEKPLVPVVATTHDRVSLEIARGCSRGCRFCNAGIVYRPVRERPVDDLVRQAVQNVQATGFSEVSLVSLSTSDYSQLDVLLDSLTGLLSERMVNLSFPSLRPERFTRNMARYARSVRKSGITLAPEAGTQRLRSVINKTTTEADLIKAVTVAFEEGWNLVKLYFMIGLPTETMEDIAGIVNLVSTVSSIAKKYKGKRINVSVSPFVPKPFTPFQWVAQDSITTLKERMDHLCSSIKQRNVKLSWRNADVAAVEGLLARGDRRLGAVVRTAWQAGANLEGWSEFFQYDRWMTALKDSGLSFDTFLAERHPDAPLPWDHIKKGVTKKFLIKEYRHSVDPTVTLDCKTHGCHSCGLSGHPVCRKIVKGRLDFSPETAKDPKPDYRYGRSKVPIPENGEHQPYSIARIRYSRDENVRFLSHLDMIRIFELAMRRADVPVAYTQGFNPKPKVSYGPSLATGHTSDAEYMDIYFRGTQDCDFVDNLTKELPYGIDIKECFVFMKKLQSLVSLINVADYKVKLPAKVSGPQIREIIDRDSIIVQKAKKGGVSKSVDIRPFIESIKLKESGLFVRTKMDNGRTVRVEKILNLLYPAKPALVNAAGIHRAGLWVRCDGVLKTPMDIDRISTVAGMCPLEK